MLKLFKKINETLIDKNMKLAIITEDINIKTCNIEFSMDSYDFTVSESGKNKFSIFRYDKIKKSMASVENVTSNEIIGVILEIIDFE